MDLNLTQTKIVLPRRPAHHLSRFRLLEYLYGIIDYPIFLVIAPAGYGKTSALVDWAREGDLPVCWYAVDELDRDPRQFIAYVIAAVAQQFPEFGAQSTATLRAMTQELDIPQLVTALVNDAYAHIREHFALIIDDYHLVQEEETISTFVSLLAQQVDENVHIVLVSRTLLTLPELPLMVARAEVGGLGYEELAFRTQEVQDLVLQNYHLTIPESEAQSLINTSEGWVTGLLLSTQTMWRGMADRARTARTSGLGLYDYMAQQVVDQQPPEVREFLLWTSLFDVYNAELCNAVLNHVSGVTLVGPRDWSTLMAAVQRSNLFVVPVGQEGTWLRYHQLFRDFLRTQVARDYPEQRRAILYRTAEVYQERQLWDRAHDIYEQLEDWDATADLIEHAGIHLIRAGQYERLRTWLGALPHTMLSGENGSRLRPGILSLKGVVASMFSNPKVGLQLQRQAEEWFRAHNQPDGRLITLLRMAVDHRMLGDYEASLDIIDRALDMIERLGASQQLEAEACQTRGLCLYWMGKLDDATTWLERALAIYEALNDARSVAMARIALGLVHMDMGAFAQARDDYKSSLDYWLQTQDTIRQATVYNNLGVLYHYEGHYREAVTALEYAVIEARRSSFIRTEGAALAGLGDIYEDLGAYDAAESAYREALELAQRANDRALNTYITLAQADLACSRGRYSLASAYLDLVQDSVSQEQTSYNQGLWRLITGRVALYQNNETAAMEHLTAANAAFAEVMRRLDHARTHVYLAIACAKQDKKREAEEHLDQALALAASLGGPSVLLSVASEFQSALSDLKLKGTAQRQITEILSQVTLWQAELSGLRRDIRRQSETIALTPPPLVLRALGIAQVENNGQIVSGAEWQAQVARDMVFCLLAHPAGLTGENLGLFFWPDKDPIRLNMHLKKTLYRIRRALGENIILFENGHYRFNFSLDYEYDVEAFEQSIATARATRDAEARLLAYKEAVGHYSGPYLSDIDGTWVLPARERLWQAYREAILALAGAAMAKQDYILVIDLSQQLLSQDNCQEDVHRLVMRAHAALGNRAAAIRQFEYCKQLLADELDITPSDETLALYATLVN